MLQYCNYNLVTFPEFKKHHKGVTPLNCMLNCQAEFKTPLKLLSLLFLVTKHTTHLQLCLRNEKCKLKIKSKIPLPCAQKNTSCLNGKLFSKPLLFPSSDQYSVSVLFTGLFLRHSR